MNENIPVGKEFELCAKRFQNNPQETQRHTTNSRAPIRFHKFNLRSRIRPIDPARPIAARRTYTQTLTPCVTPIPTGARLPLNARASPPGLEGHLPGLKAILLSSVAALLTRRRRNMARISLRTDSTDEAPEFSSLITLTENSKSPPATSTSLRICSTRQLGQVQKSVTNLAAAAGKLCAMDR